MKRVKIGLCFAFIATFGVFMLLRTDPVSGQAGGISLGAPTGVNPALVAEPPSVAPVSHGKALNRPQVNGSLCSSTGTHSVVKAHTTPVRRVAAARPPPA